MKNILMITNIWLYSLLPTLVCFLGLILIQKIWVSNGAIEYIKLFSNLIAINIFQVIAYFTYSLSPSYAQYAADAYLISAYFLFTHLMILSLSLSNEPKNQRYYRYLYMIPAILTAFHLSGFMVESYRIEKNSLMHNDGTFAWLFDAHIIFSSLLTAYIFYHNIKSSRNNNILASRNVIALISFIPLALAFCLLSILSMTEHAVPVVVVIPLISIYILMVFSYISNSQIIDLSIGFRFFLKRLQLAHLILKVLRTKQDINSFKQALEKQLIEEALMEHKNAIQATADSLRMNHTTLRNKIKEYNLVT